MKKYISPALEWKKVFTKDIIAASAEGLLLDDIDGYGVVVKWK